MSDDLERVIRENLADDGITDEAVARIDLQEAA